MFPELRYYITSAFGPEYHQLRAWNNWTVTIDKFMQKFFPAQHSKGVYTNSLLIYFFARHNYLYPQTGRLELQCLLQWYCEPLHRDSVQLLLDDIHAIHSKIPDQFRPKGYVWTKGWSRILRHMNQFIPFVRISEGAPVYCYGSVFTDPDDYNNLTSPLAVLTDAKGLVDETVRAIQINPVQLHKTALSVIATMDDAVMWNLPLLFKNGFKFHEIDDPYPTLAETLETPASGLHAQFFDVKEYRALRVRVFEDVIVKDDD